MKLFRKIITLSAILAVTFSTASAFALSEAEYRKINSYDGRFYLPDATSYDGTPGGSLCPQDGNISSGLSDNAIEKLQAISKLNNIPDGNMEAYLYGEQQTGVKWQALAALHFTEGGMNPDQSMLNGAKLGSGVNVDGMVVGNTLKEDAVIAANALINMGKSVYNVDVSSPSATADDYGWAYLAYGRGYMYKVDNIPYDMATMVMNFYDNAHWDMVWLHQDSWYGDKQYNSLEGKHNGNPGKLTVFTYLSNIQLDYSFCDNFPVVAVDGKVFPLGGATKSNLLTNANFGSGSSVLSQPTGWYHHDYSAADLGIMMQQDGGDCASYSFTAMYCYSVGAPVLAISDGTVSYYKHYSNKVASDWVEKCAQIGFTGDDGTTYWYGHLAYEDAYSVPGKVVHAGDVIGHVGMPQCAQGTQAHLHIDIESPILHDSRITDIIQATYEALPE
ncbi:MAG: M23 family metallopeptidase [Candidatus Nomurabacteria bacterium]|jgi:hypothetical protein|nr:M23 family metallopeptidase [Candidatus Nomurabacteria bacterium]